MTSLSLAAGDLVNLTIKEEEAEREGGSGTCRRGNDIGMEEIGQDGAELGLEGVFSRG